jgi:hypothetical protein
VFNITLTVYHFFIHFTIPAHHYILESFINEPLGAKGYVECGTFLSAIAGKKSRGEYDKLSDKTFYQGQQQHP